MPDVLTHFAVVFGATSPIYGIKRGFIFGLFSVLPDLDVLFYVHRSISHSIVFLLLVSLPFIAFLWRFYRGLFWTGIGCLLALLVHPVFDVFGGFTPLFYPLMPDSLLIEVHGGVLFGSSFAPFVSVSVYTKPTVFEPFTEFEGVVFSGVSLPVSLVLILLPLLYRAVKFRTGNI